MRSQTLKCLILHVPLASGVRLNQCFRASRLAIFLETIQEMLERPRSSSVGARGSISLRPQSSSTRGEASGVEYIRNIYIVVSNVTDSKSAFQKYCKDISKVGGALPGGSCTQKRTKKKQHSRVKVEGVTCDQHAPGCGDAHLRRSNVNRKLADREFTAAGRAHLRTSTPPSIQRPSGLWEHLELGVSKAKSSFLRWDRSFIPTRRLADE